MRKTVVLLAAHKLNDFIRDQYTKLAKATGQYLDAFLLLETDIPTLLNYLGYIIYDLGGTGDFALPGFRNLFYTSILPLDSSYTGSTMIFRLLFGRNEIELENESNKLYHPVKR